MDAEWLATLPPNLWSSIQAALTIRDFLLLVPSNAFDALAACVGDNPETPLNAKYHLVFYSIMRGHLKAAEESLARLRLEPFAELSGIIALARGNVEEAVIRFEQELTHLKKETGKRKACFTGLLGVFHQLALIRAGLPEHLKTAVQLAAFGLKQGNGGGVASCGNGGGVASCDATNHAEDRFRRRLYPIELETGAVLTVILASRKDWHSALYAAMPLYRNIRREGIRL